MTSWAIKHRPETFEEVYGNEIAIKQLQGFVEMDYDQRPHTILFSGPTGCGKTTLARIFANEIGCGISSPDYHEYNAALTKGIDVVRELEPCFRIRPSQGNTRVFLFEEVHQTTKPFQEAMLRPTEDTTESTFFIFCTTEPNLLIPALKKRFTEIKIQPLASRQLIKLLKDILDKENKSISNTILKKITNLTNGEPRDSIKIIEKICNLTEEEMNSELDNLDMVTKSTSIAYNLLIGENWENIKSTIIGDGIEPEKIRIGILNYMAKVATGNSKQNLKTRAQLIATYFLESFAYADGKAKLIFNCIDAFNE